MSALPTHAMAPPTHALVKAEADRLSTAFIAAGALPFETAALQPAETLLDLYGEDIRARAYVTHDPVLGELMLRPDFTVPVVQMHMAHGAEPARYTYQGPVWRKQEASSGRASEYMQVGFEVFDRQNPVNADAEVFALFQAALSGLNLRPATGDLGVLIAAVDALKTTQQRKAALKHHIWRPRRFRQLLDSFGNSSGVPPTRADLLRATETHASETLWRAAGTHVGLRDLDEISARITALQHEAATAPISAEEIGFLASIIDTCAKSDAALASLRQIETGLPALGPALDRMAARLDAMDARGIDVTNLDFEGSYGRTTMEYYDGFVFGFYASDRDDLPIVASGGRYDALTAILGHKNSIPAVGGVVRPEIIVALGRGAT